MELSLKKAGDRDLVNDRRTIVEAVCKSHHRHGHLAAVGTVEHPLLCQFGVEGDLPKALEMEGIQEDHAGLVTQRSRRQEVLDGT